MSTHDDPPPFRPVWWLPGRHLQTIVPSLLWRGAPVRYVRERWETPDGDFVVVDRAAPDPGSSEDASSPTLVVFHGLEGSSQSRYVRDLIATATARGWHGIAINFRSCSGVINDRPRFYHAGDSAEVDWILRRVANERVAVGNAASGGDAPGETGRAPLFAVGVSLGGNVLLKWLGERGVEAAPLVAGAAAVSASMDLPTVGHQLGRGFDLLYAKFFLKSLKRKGSLKLQQFPRLFDGVRMKAARDLRTYDDTVIAPLHGFRDVEDYWTRSSSKPLLRGIAVPTLILNARNDPFQPASALPGPDDVSPQVTLHFESEGGHVGFVDAGPDGIDWMPRRVVRYLAAHASRIEARQQLAPGAEAGSL